MKSPLYGDEGMWLLNAIPRARVKLRYGVDLPSDFGERVMTAAVRLNNGGSASFVSKQGLIITNHHVAHSLIASVSTADNDMVKNGFYAASRSEEIKIPQAEANVLDSIEDVTERVTKKTGPARKAEIANIELESKSKTGLRSDVVELYKGGAYHLYRYRKYTDVRLVFAPEASIAHFGGDFDNYEFPRYCLDITFLRIYEDGKPVKPREHLRMSERPVDEEELLMVAGHPGNTERITTLAAIEDMRDRGLPYRLSVLRRLEISFDQYAGRGVEYARRAEREIATIKNLRKRYVGQLNALQDPAFMSRVAEREHALKQFVRSRSDVKKKVGDPWKDIERALAEFKKLAIEYDLFESMIGMGGHYDKPRPTKSFWTTYLGLARTIVRMAEEDKKPSGARLPEFADARRDSLLAELYSPDPVYNDLEIWKLGDAFAHILEVFGPHDTLVKKILNGKSPRARAAELVKGTTLEDIENRRRLVEGGAKAVRSSQDPMIQLALLIDARARMIRVKIESRVKARFEAAYAKLAVAEFLAYGVEHYPDATFTLRLAFGTPKSVVLGDASYPHYTTLSGVLEHWDEHERLRPWELPKSWQEQSGWLKDAHEQFNFITTHDSHGGNSGSPVFTKDFEFTGILFDGIQSGQGSSFVYGDYERAVCVASQGILALLKEVYRADALIDELRPK